MEHIASGEIPGARKLDTFLTVGCGKLEVATESVTLLGRCPPPRHWWALSLAEPRSEAVPCWA